MTPMDKDALELEIGVFSGLITDLDQKDDNILNVLSNILDRLSRHGDLPQSITRLFASTKDTVTGMVFGDTNFADGYNKLCDTAEKAQRWLKTLDQRQPYESSNASDLPAAERSVNSSGPQGIGDQNSSADIAAFISECRDYLDSAELNLVELEKDPSDREKLNELFRAFHNIKGTSGFLSLTDMQNLSHSAESLMEGVRSERIPLSEAVAESGFRAIDMLARMLDAVEGALSGHPYLTPSGLDTLIESMRTQTEDDKSESGSPETHSNNDSSTSESPTTGSCASGTPRSIPEKTKASDLVRVSISRLDSLVDAVGELVIANSMVSQEVQSLAHTNPLLARNMDRMGKTIRELQELATGVRMITLEGMFRKMVRVVRDIAAKSGNLVDFSYGGGETEIDRNMVEEMTSPLIHLIRNAVDHGLEPAAERRSLGKSETGKVNLSAYHQGGNVVIRVEDDGRGLDRRKIFDKAVSRGLIKPGADIPDKEVYQLIYLPGFSTAERITEVSGRGVGMDVVKQAIETLHGRIDISTTLGEGTIFTIRLPLTMAIIEGMVISVARQRYIVPVSAIQESLRPVPDQIFSVAGKGEMLLLRGTFIPIVRLHQLFGLSGANENPCEALVVIIADADQRCAVLADDLIGQQQVVVKPLDGIFRHVEAVSGAAIVGDGAVSLILDPGGLIQTSKGA